jgi:hypothetical protein
MCTIICLISRFQTTGFSQWTAVNLLVNDWGHTGMLLSYCIQMGSMWNKWIPSVLPATYRFNCVCLKFWSTWAVKLKIVLRIYPGSLLSFPYSSCCISMFCTNDILLWHLFTEWHRRFIHDIVVLWTRCFLFILKSSSQTVSYRKPMVLKQVDKT